MAVMGAELAHLRGYVQLVPALGDACGLASIHPEIR
jgi:hypothetical protein